MQVQWRGRTSSGAWAGGRTGLQRPASNAGSGSGPLPIDLLGAASIGKYRESGR